MVIISFKILLTLLISNYIKVDLLLKGGVSSIFNKVKNYSKEIGAILKKKEVTSLNLH